MSATERVHGNGWSLRLLMVAAALLFLPGWIVWSKHLAKHVELWLHGEPPKQFYLDLDGDLLDDYSPVFGVAHNAGDRLATTREGLAHGADVIEIDVVSVSGVLYAAHSTPPRVVTRHVYRGPRLDLVWAAATEADVIALDLKQTSPRYMELVTDFLLRHSEQPVMVSTPDRANLEMLAARAPHALRMLSVGSDRRFAAIQGDSSLAALVDGIALRETLLTEERATWIKERGLLLVAWTVDDLRRTNELITMGVDGITTGNLAILELLGGQERDETLLSRAARFSRTGR